MLAQLPDNLLLRCIQKTEELSFTRLRRTCKGLRDFVDNNVYNLRISCTDHFTTRVKFIFGAEHEVIVETINGSGELTSKQTVEIESFWGYYFYSVQLSYNPFDPWNSTDEFGKCVAEVMKTAKIIRCGRLVAFMSDLQPGALASAFRTIKFESISSWNVPTLYNYPEVLNCKKTEFSIRIPGSICRGTATITVEDDRISGKVILSILERNKSMEEFCTAIDDLAHLKIETDIDIDFRFPYHYKDGRQAVNWISNWDLKRSISFDEWDFILEEFENTVDLHVFLKRGPRKDRMILLEASHARTNFYLSTVDLRSVQSIFSILYNIRPGGLIQRVVDFSCLHDKWIDYEGDDLFDRLFADFQTLWLK